MSHYSGAGIRGLGALLSLSWLRCAGLAPMWAAYLCCRAVPVLAFTPCVGGSCSISLATAPCLLPAKILSMDFTPLCVSFIDIYFSLLWKLFLPSAYGEGWLLFCLQVTSTCRGFTGFQHQVCLRSSGHCIFQADQQTGYLILLCLLHISSSVCTRFWKFNMSPPRVTLPHPSQTPEQLRLASATCVSILVTQGRNLNTTLSSL